MLNDHSRVRKRQKQTWRYLPSRLQWPKQSHWPAFDNRRPRIVGCYRCRAVVGGQRRYRVNPVISPAAIQKIYE